MTNHSSMSGRQDACQQKAHNPKAFQAGDIQKLMGDLEIIESNPVSFFAARERLLKGWLAQSARN